MKKENPFINIAFNIVLPVFILQKGPKWLGQNHATEILLVALAIPLLYAIYDYRTRHVKNWMSVFGIFNILVTGGLALLRLEGLWFAVKEAAFPALLGIGVIVTAFTRSPFMELLTWNPQMMNVDRVQSVIDARQLNPQLRVHLKNSTLLFALSFFLSAILNFVLARNIFVEIPLELAEAQRSEILNDQIAKMTSMSFFVIMIPLFFVSAFVFWHLFRGIQKLTGLTFDEIMPTASTQQVPNAAPKG